mmetsp:Transcript_30923/g.63158  ORF Transcript_30923/g.63158 Transcript_30923/m.63158 type:complete len:510 (-) Transcript_30923:52-1581(-)
MHYLQNLRRPPHNPSAGTHVHPPRPSIERGVDPALRRVTHHHPNHVAPASLAQFLQTVVNHFLRHGVLGWKVGGLGIVAHPDGRGRADAAAQALGHVAGDGPGAALSGGYDLLYSLIGSGGVILMVMRLLHPASRLSVHTLNSSIIFQVLPGQPGVHEHRPSHHAADRHPPHQLLRQQPPRFERRPTGRLIPRVLQPPSVRTQFGVEVRADVDLELEVAARVRVLEQTGAVERFVVAVQGHQCSAGGQGLAGQGAQGPVALELVVPSVQDVSGLNADGGAAGPDGTFQVAFGVHDSRDHKERLERVRVAVHVPERDDAPSRFEVRHDVGGGRGQCVRRCRIGKGAGQDGGGGLGVGVSVPRRGGVQRRGRSVAGAERTDALVPLRRRRRRRRRGGAIPPGERRRREGGRGRCDAGVRPSGRNDEGRGDGGRGRGGGRGGGADGGPPSEERRGRPGPRAGDDDDARRRRRGGGGDQERRGHGVQGGDEKEGGKAPTEQLGSSCHERRKGG